MGEGRGKGGVGRGKGRGSTRLLGVLPAARRRQVGVHRVARALEEARRLRHAAAHAGPLLGRGFGRGCGAAAVVAEEAAEDAVGRRGAGPPTGARRDIRSWMAQAPSTVVRSPALCGALPRQRPSLSKAESRCENHAVATLYERSER